MVSGIVRSLLNILLDWLLIFGQFGLPQLGLAGAALATVIADVTGLVVLAILLLVNRQVAARPDRDAWRSLAPAHYGEVVRMGLPTSLEDMLWNIGNLFLISYLNRLDPLAAAVYGIVFTIEILPIVMFMSLGQGTTILAGRAKGAGDSRRIRAAVVTAQVAAWIASGLTVLVFLGFGQALAGVFTSDSKVLERVLPILLVSCLTFFPRSVNFMAGSGIRGFGDTRWMLTTQVFGTVFIVALGHLLILDLGYGVIGLFVAMCIDELVRAVANGVRFTRLIRSAIPAEVASVGDRAMVEET
jgi:Na+-driven multidrug efflux pump